MSSLLLPMRYSFDEQIVVQRDEYEKMLQRLEQLESTIDNAVEGITRTTRDGRYLFANRAYALMLGYESPDELLSAVNNIPEQIFVNGEERAQRIRQLDLLKIFRGEYEARKKDGSTIWCSVGTRSVFDKKGQFLYYESIVEDVTKMKQREEELQCTAAALKRSNTELERFAKVVAHDLVQPLCTVESYCLALVDLYESALDDEGKEYLRSMQGAVSRMRGSIRDVLDVSRFDTSGLDCTVTDLNEVIAGVLNDLKVMIEESCAHINCEVLPTLYVDRAKIQRLLQNLLSNSLKYRKQGVPVKIDIRVEKKASHWRFSVRDNGVGFDPKDSARVFDMFSRLSNQSHFPGLGIGLAMCKRVVEMHGGRIWVDPTPGVGTTFYFSLPI